MVLLVAPSPTPLPASPSPAASSKPRPLFTVPKTWVHLKPSGKEAGFTDLGGYIFEQDGKVQEFNVLQAPSGGLDLATMTKINLQDLARTEKSFRLLSEQNVSLCSGQQGRLIKYHTTSNGKLLMLEQLFAVSGLNGYVLTYSRAAADKDDPAALAALRSLCPPLAARIAADTTPVPFTPPPGWQRLNAAAIPGDLSGMLGFWIHPAGGAVPESMNVIKSDSRIGSLTTAQEGDLALSQVKQKFPSAAVRQSHAETLCSGTQPGWYLEYAVKMNNLDYIIEQSIIFAENVQYAVTYGRPAAQPEDAAARRALDTLCAAGAQVSS
jgi:hypothetical protein